LNEGADRERNGGADVIGAVRFSRKAAELVNRMGSAAGKAAVIHLKGRSMHQFSFPEYRDKNSAKKRVKTPRSIELWSGMMFGSTETRNSGSFRT